MHLNHVDVTISEFLLHSSSLYYTFFFCFLSVFRVVVSSAIRFISVEHTFFYRSCNAYTRTVSIAVLTHSNVTCACVREKQKRVKKQLSKCEQSNKRVRPIHCNAIGFRLMQKKNDCAKHRMKNMEYGRRHQRLRNST